MAIETHNNTRDYPATLEELVDDMQHPSGKYKNLEIILNRNDNRYLGLGQKYLVVSAEGFGVYRLLDIHYAKGIIRLDLENTSNGNVSSTPLDVNNKHPEVFLLAWEDIRQLVFENSIRRIIDDELFEPEERVTGQEKNISSSGRKV